MSKRYYITRIIGDGSEDNPYRGKVSLYNVGQATSIPSDDDPESPNYGKPLYEYGLSLVNTADHTALAADPEIDALPDFPLDGKFMGISEVVRSAMLSSLQARGYSVTGINDVDGYRDVIEWIGKQREACFNIDNFDSN
jgi:hypothetical protein